MKQASADDMPVPQLREAFRLTLSFGKAALIGRLATGGERRVSLVTAGSITGERLNGEVISGSEIELARGDGVTTLEISYLVRANDGTLIRLMGNGVRARSSFAGIRTTISFEVDENSSHAWLATRAFIAERPEGSDTIVITQIV
ncbi:MAG: DUF3237 family protein [Sphingomonas sp.]|nr:DUF3237 family protein [Sphingomonas sp.]